MSIARVKRVAKARKDQGKCGRCGDPLPAGVPYRWWTVGFRSRFKRKRCMKEACTPKTSELESSQLSEAYAAQEEALEAISALTEEFSEATDASAIEEVVSTYSEALNDLASTYREADEAIGGGGYTDSGERADMLEEAAGELAGFNGSYDPEPCEDHEEPQDGCDACEEQARTAWQEVLGEAETLIQDTSFS